MQTSRDRKGGVYRAWAIGLLAIVIICLYFVRAARTGTVTIHNHRTAEFYQLLTDAFLAGQLHLLLKPEPELLALKNPYDEVLNAPYRLHDASLFEDKYYIYYSPTPVVTLFLPYRVLFGSHMPNFVALPIFCSSAFLFLLALMLLIQKHELWETPLWIDLGMVVCLGLGAFVPFLLKRPAYYEVAIASGCCFSAAGFLFLFLAVRRPVISSPATLLSGVCLGLSLASRPQLVMPISLICGLFFVHALRRGLRFLSLRHVAILCCPIAALGIAVLWYNYARFRNPLEFGQHYQLAGSQAGTIQVHLSALPTGLYDYLFSPMALSRHLPFFRAKTGAPPWDPGRVSSTLEPIVGMFCAAPLTALPLLWPLLARARASAARICVSAPTALLLSSLGIFVAILALFIASTGWATLRYTVDFSPAAMLLGILTGMSVLSQLKPRPISLLGAAFLLTVAWTVAVNLGISVGEIARETSLDPLR